MSPASQAGASAPDHVSDQLRAQQWGLLARVLSSGPDQQMLDALGDLAGDGTALGNAYDVLAQTARATSEQEVRREFFELFVGVGRGELLPYASFYLTGFLNERPLADLRRDLAAMGIERAKDRHGGGALVVA